MPKSRSLETAAHAATRNELRAIRHRLQWTQRAIADHLGCDSNTVARYERGNLAIPLVVLNLARQLLAHPPPDEELPPVKRRQYHRKKLRWDVAFVLVRELTPAAPCWYARTHEDGGEACGGGRFLFSAMLPPSPEVSERLTETVTCEAHAYLALAGLKEQYIRWMRPRVEMRQEDWHKRWVKAQTQQQEKEGPTCP